MLLRSAAGVRADIHRATLGLLTLLVAFCSLVYELIFSQTLTVLFGSTVTRYSMTIGLYLFSLGIGAFLFSRVARRSTERTFYLVELALCVIGPLGVVAMFYVNSTSSEILLSEDGQRLLLVVSHVPVVAVGLLSGLELPLLTALSPDRASAFYRVLGWDYFGSLLGGVLWALWLYPRHGLLGAALGVGFLNAVAAVAFFAASWPRRRVGLAVNAVLLLVYLLVLQRAPDLTELVRDRYLSASILQRYWGRGTHAERVEIVESLRTRYQEVVEYRLTWASGGRVDQCIDIDNQVQMCDFWVDTYHHALIDVPIAAFAPERSLRVLLVGGGDFIPMHFLRQHADRIDRVDHVDIDAEFLEFARHNPLVSRFHRGAIELPFVVTHIRDGLSFLRQSRATYDLVLLDLPGVSADKLLHLYSVEFFSFVRRSLAPDGLVASWAYPSRREMRHAAVYRSTLWQAGFRRWLPYRAIATHEDGAAMEMDNFVLVSTGATPLLDLEAPYIAGAATYWERRTWQPLRELPGVPPNSMFAPNHNMVVRQDRGPPPFAWERQPPGG